MLAGSILVCGGTLFALNTYPGKAKLIQRIEKNEGADLFGETGTPIGSPQQYIIEDPKAFTGKKTTDGAEEVDEKYLRDNKIYPLQLQTVRFIAQQSQLVSGATFILSLIVFFWSKKRISSAKQE